MNGIGVYNTKQKQEYNTNEMSGETAAVLEGSAKLTGGGNREQSGIGSGRKDAQKDPA